MEAAQAPARPAQFPVHNRRMSKICARPIFVSPSLLASERLRAEGRVSMTKLRESRVGALSSVRRVLLVDDQQDSAELMGMLLEQQGHEVRIAYDGESALALALDFEPQIGLFDLGLPIMNGYELAASIRAVPRLSACRLIAISGYDSASDRARSRSAGFEQHLAKPLSLDALLLVIATPGDELRTSRN